MEGAKRYSASTPGRGRSSRPEEGSPLSSSYSSSFSRYCQPSSCACRRQFCCQFFVKGMEGQALIPLSLLVVILQLYTTRLT